MSKFDKYFLMEEKDILEYVQEKYDFFDENSKLTCKEIGDGNLNYVFRVTDGNTGYSVILKHSGIETRSKSGRLVNVDRNRIEAENLMHQAKYVPKFVPKVYGYDDVMCCCAMEDLKNYEIMRTALLQYHTFPNFADHISTYMVDILLPTTDVAMNHKEKKNLVKNYINPDLCEITEQLVYTESLGNFSNKNYVVDPLKDFVQKEIYDDETLRLEGAKLKFDFMNHAQALIHGDLHSGSVFVNESETKIFDPEFAFYGPMGYDVGNVVAHLLFAMFHAEATLEESEQKEEFTSWVLKTIQRTINLFVEKFTKKFDEIVKDPMAKTKGFKEYYLKGVLKDSSATAGIEVIRRIVGVAKVKDITSIEDENKRAEVEMKMLKIAKEFIFNRENIKTGEDYLNVICKHVK